MKMIFIFIDGLGLGENDENKNPLIRANTPYLDYIFKNFTVIPTDPCLGIPGLPQSATGQTAIFTGVNASSVLGRHLSGQPTLTLKKIILKNNLFKELIRRGLKVTNSNVYRQEYLDKMLDPKDRRTRPSVTSVMCLSCSRNFRTIDDYKQGNGVYHDIVGQILIDSGYEVDLINPEEAARRLYSISRNYDFTLYEHFITDIIGHTTDMEKAVSAIERLDSFLGGLIKLVDLKKDMIFITSDHGNIEDISVKTHTFNKVPTIIMGDALGEIRLKIESLLDITPAILKIFEARR